MKFVYPAIFTPLANSAGYDVTFPDFSGLIARGDDLPAAIESAQKNAAKRLVSELRKTTEDKSHKIPMSSDIADIIPPSPSFASLIMFDLDRCFEDEGSNKPVKVQCNIPAWMNEIVKAKDIDCSKILQETLIAKLIYGTE